MFLFLWFWASNHIMKYVVCEKHPIEQPSIFLKHNKLYWTESIVNSTLTARTICHIIRHVGNNNHIKLLIDMFKFLEYRAQILKMKHLKTWKVPRWLSNVITQGLYWVLDIYIWGICHDLTTQDNSWRCRCRTPSEDQGEFDAW